MIEEFNILRSYNFWDGRMPNLGFFRKDYVEKLMKYTNNRLIKIITGQRRVGKSYIMRQIISELIKSGVDGRQIFYFNKEVFAFESINTANQLSELIQLFEKEISGSDKKYIFIDEVQDIKNWEKLISSLSQDYNVEYEVFITGSNSNLLSGELATLLSGRYVQFEVMSFSYIEYIEYLNLSQNRDSYLQYLKSGGLPELFHLPEEELKMHYISSLKDTIVLRDIVQRYKIKDVFLLENLFKYLVDNIGNLYSVNALTKFLIGQKIKTNNETLGSYLEFLKNTYLVHGVERYDIKGKAILSGLQKVYLNDLAFRNLLSSFSVGWGQQLENAVYLFFRSKGFKIYVGGINAQEIDFVVEKNNKIMYVQVAQEVSNEQLVKREFGNLELIRDNYQKIVVSLDEQKWGNRNGIEHVLAWELENYINKVF